jgi:hypothetical protein
VTQYFELNFKFDAKQLYFLFLHSNFCFGELDLIALSL